MKKSEKIMTVYEQLGFPDAEEMLVKAQLVSQIGEILRERGWSREEHQNQEQGRGDEPMSQLRTHRVSFRLISSLPGLGARRESIRSRNKFIGTEEEPGSNATIVACMRTAVTVSCCPWYP